VHVADPVFVHIGPPKTGTTYLQSVLWSNRATLKDQGLLVPGRSPVSQFHAAVDLLDRDPTRVGAERTAGSWETLVDELRGWNGRAVVSHENFGYADDAQADRAKLSLEAKEIHVIFTAREFSRVVPAMWQERLKNRSEDTWSSYVEALGTPTVKAGRGFWHQQGGTGLLAWAAGLPVERVHIVTVPPAGSPSTLLWERFASVLGIDPASCNTDVPRTNESLGVVESAFLRQFNVSSSEVEWDAYRAHVKHFLAPRVLAQRADAARIEIQPTELVPLAEHAHQLVEIIESRGFDVVGDLADLAPTSPLRTDRTPVRETDDVSDADLLEVAFDAVAGLVAHAEEIRQARQEQAATTREVRRELRETRRRLDELRAVNRRLHLRLDKSEYELERSATRRAISRFLRKHAWAAKLRDIVLRRNRRTNDGEST
jgi:hypothetical protein